MLTITMSHRVLKQYDAIVKDFLWEGKKLMIKFSKICSPEDNGGLGLSHSKIILYFLFEMDKIAKHWNKYNHLEWVNIENKL